MNYKRREFLKTAGVLGSGLLLGSMSSYLQGCKTSAGMKDISENFGLQLYTLRDDMPGDPKGILSQVASFGYREIESFAGDKGMFWGMTNIEFKKLMDDLGMNVVASHTDIYKDFERTAEKAAAIGMKYLVCPYLGPQKKLDDYKKAADTFNSRGEICKKNGLKFAYHNHDYSFKKINGQYPQDVMMQNTDKDHVEYEMDIYWVVTAGADPEEWLKKYPGRFTLSHIKDRMNVPISETNASTVLGTGIIDYGKILQTAKENGMKHFFVEQERYDNTTPVEATKKNAEYLKRLKV